jgi:hypothetical protein
MKTIRRFLRIRLHFSGGMACCWPVKSGGQISSRWLFSRLGENTQVARNLISNRLSRRSIERRMGMGQASRSGLRDVACLFGVDTFNRRYECCDHCNR